MRMTGMRSRGQKWIHLPISVPGMTWYRNTRNQTVIGVALRGSSSASRVRVADIEGGVSGGQLKAIQR